MFRAHKSVVLYLRFFRCRRLCSCAATSCIVAAAMCWTCPVRRLVGHVGCHRLPRKSEVHHVSDFDPCPFGCLWTVEVQDYDWQATATFEGQTFLDVRSLPKLSSHISYLSLRFIECIRSIWNKYEDQMWKSILLEGKCQEVNTCKTSKKTS